MDVAAARQAVDEQLRRHAAQPGYVVEVEERVTRCIASGGGWAAVIWSDLDERSADQAIAREGDRLGGLEGEFEWTLRSSDQPADLAERFRDAGFVAGPA